MVVAVVDSSGITAPTYDAVLSEIKDAYRGIYGADVYIEEDSQDGQMLAIFALAITDANALAVAVFNAFSPATAKGEGLSRNVKINGIRRLVATYSSVTLTISGTVGTLITNGVARDASGQRWLLPASVTIPSGGTIDVTATAETLGAIQAQASSITIIATPTRGWNGVVNAAAAVPGEPVETDAELRARQAVSVALPSQTVLAGLVGALLSITGVTRLRAYENDTAVTDGNGIPSHTVAFVIEGGDNTEIAKAILAKKTIGTGTAGATAVTVADAFGISHVIRFARPMLVTIHVRVTMTALAGYSSPIGVAVQEALVVYLNGLAIGNDVVLTKLYPPAYLNGEPNGNLFDITAIETSLDGSSWSAVGRTIAYNEAATAATANIVLVVS